MAIHIIQIALGFYEGMQYIYGIDKNGKLYSWNQNLKGKQGWVLQKDEINKK